MFKWLQRWWQRTFNDLSEEEMQEYVDYYKEAAERKPYTDEEKDEPETD